MSKRLSISARFLSVFVCTAVVLSACNDAKPKPQPAPQVTIIANANPNATGQAVRPPRPLGSPVLVDRSPASGEELQPDKPIELTFDQPMDKASVAENILIGGQPIASSLKLEWAADNVVRILPPTGGWQKNAGREQNAS